MRITNLTISGGNQTFADTIINQYPNATLDENDQQIIAFIGSLEIVETEKLAAAQNVAKINDAGINVQEKATALSQFTAFLKMHEQSLKKWASVIGKATLAIILTKYGLTLAEIGLE